MRVKERDELFGRIDERTRNIWVLTEKQEEHLTKLNGALLDLNKQVSSNKTNIKWIIRILVASGIIGGSTAGLVQLFT